ncbi:DUF1501 domain-containing protein [Amphritea sp.]|uniref:DUF1501 domain-containing protein n=1 Tax=Amphritea sp. TaxID=1872502 RepID=UPI003D14C1C5
MGTGINRRQFIQACGILTLGFTAPIALAGHSSDPRLVVLVLRGGMDGLAAVPPYADPAYQSARGKLALGSPGTTDGVIDLDGFFGLNPAFENLARMYRQGEALLLQAIAPPYAKRSHFYAQDVLETGLTDPSGHDSGWLYRALSGLSRGRAPEQYAYSLGAGMPRIVQGDSPVGAWAPDRLPDPDDATLQRLMALYEHDRYLGPKLQAGFNADEMISSMGGKLKGVNNLATVAKAAARFLSRTDGPRVAVMDSGGWDTHARQGTTKGPLANKFRELDNVLARFKEDMGPVWNQTAVLVVTEFGRTVAVNGTFGSDHGVGSAAFLLGGAVNGGRVHSDWPGLAKAKLYEGRDLKPTLDMRALFAGVLHQHMGLDRGFIEEQVFPGYRDQVSGLVRTG